VEEEFKGEHAAEDEEGEDGLQYITAGVRQPFCPLFSKNVLGIL
jgi:hypothetical protein